MEAVDDPSLLPADCQFLDLQKQPGSCALHSPENSVDISFGNMSLRTIHVCYQLCCVEKNDLKMKAYAVAMIQCESKVVTGANICGGAGLQIGVSPDVCNCHC